MSSLSKVFVPMARCRAGSKRGIVQPSDDRGDDNHKAINRSQKTLKTPIVLIQKLADEGPLESGASKSRHRI
jgi:hypothetical protein